MKFVSLSFIGYTEELDLSQSPAYLPSHFDHHENLRAAHAQGAAVTRMRRAAEKVALQITPLVKLRPDTSFVTALVAPRLMPLVVARFGKLVLVAVVSARPRSGGRVKEGFVATGGFVVARDGSVEFVDTTVAEPGSARSDGTEMLVLTVDWLLVSTVVVVPETGTPGSGGSAAVVEPAAALTPLLLLTMLFVELVELVRLPSLPTSRLARTNCIWP